MLFRSRGLLLYLTTLLPGITPPLIINNTSKATVQTYEVNVGSLTNNAVFTALAVREESVYNSPYLAMSIITSGKGRELRRAIPFILSMKPAGYQRYFLHITN